MKVRGDENRPWKRAKGRETGHGQPLAVFTAVGSRRLSVLGPWTPSQRRARSQPARSSDSHGAQARLRHPIANSEDTEGHATRFSRRAVASGRRGCRSDVLVAGRDQHPAPVVPLDPDHVFELFPYAAVCVPEARSGRDASIRRRAPSSAGSGRPLGARTAVAYISPRCREATPTSTKPG
jgi:hypothetical protein